MNKQVAALKVALTAFRNIIDLLEDEDSGLLAREGLFPLAQIRDALADAGVSDEESNSL